MARALITINDGDTLTKDIGFYKLPIRTDLSGNTWQKTALEIEVLSGSKPPTKGSTIIFNYVFSTFTIEADALAGVFPYAAKIPVVLSDVANGKVIAISALDDVRGNYLYSWLTVQSPLGADVIVTSYAAQIV